MPRSAVVVLVVAFLGLLVRSVSAHSASSVQAEHTPSPEAVIIAGTFQEILGCEGDWLPECETTQMTFDETHQLWLATFDLPAGDYEYKAAINNAWDESYGVNAEEGGANIGLSVSADASVTFLYNPRTHYIADDINRIFANLPGNWNAEIGCPDTAFDDPGNPGDWAPDCWQTLLEDPDGDGIYSYTTNQLEPGDYEGKVAVGGSWAENYGDGGAPGGGNIGFVVAKPNADVVFEWNSETKVLTIAAAGAPKGNLKEQAAHWVALDTILTPEDAENSFTLHYSPDASLTIGEDGVSGGESFELEADGVISAETRRKFPHLGLLTALSVPDEVINRSGELLKGQLILAVDSPDGTPVTATGLQLAGVLDEKYTYGGPLGIEWQDGAPIFRLWAPTAQVVELIVLPDPESGITVANPVYEMVFDEQTGVWTHDELQFSPNSIYRYQVTVYAPSEGAVVTNDVTDPYSVGLTENSWRSVVIDLNSAETQPDGWQSVQKPPLAAFEDTTIYELHVRDFSIIDETVPEAQRGTYSAFTVSGSAGMQHLSALADAGLTHLHLLPVFDIATIEENRDEQSAPLNRFLANFPPDSDQQQQAIFNLRDQDGFNWGYDPYHYTVPEGSYAVDPNGVARIREFRSMVQALNATGLRVVMDVVYNHTNAGGQADKSVLDKIVPGYYHRLNSKGKIENSTCCANTATEHNMMRKLMVDSVVTWARDYKIDGFRFDLMGHHMIADMQAVRDALDQLTLEKDGVDGKAIYIYGEGWNFGEVASGQRGPNATQLAVGGMGIGTFNDRIRDAIRGGNPFGGEQEQGFATGLLTNPNATQAGEGEAEITLLKMADQIRVGLAGNLADYELVNNRGQTVTGSAIDYNGSATGYTEDPQEVINYASAHDNETLFDAIQFKLPLEADMATRVAHQNFALDLVMLGQGVPFFHAGSDLLRSKSADRDSYNSGDWFNAIDWTYTDNNWGKGLPVADKNESKWDIIAPLLANETLQPAQSDILANATHFRLMLQLRQSSPLFRLRTAEEIQQRLTFHNTGPEQIPGLIVMSLDDSGAVRIDPNFNRIVVLFNGRSDEATFTIDDLASVEMTLHPLLAASSNSLYTQASYENGTFTVPPVSTMVFVQAGDATAELESEFAAPLQAVASNADSSEETEDEADLIVEESEDKVVMDEGETNSAETTLIPFILAVVFPLAIVGFALLVVMVFLGILLVHALSSGDES